MTSGSGVCGGEGQGVFRGVNLYVTAGLLTSSAWLLSYPVTKPLPSWAGAARSRPIREGDRREALAHSPEHLTTRWTLGAVRKRVLF